MNAHYAVTARMWAGGWELHITDASGTPVGVTQAKLLSDAETMAADFLMCLLDLRPSEIGIAVEAELELAEQAKQARRALDEATTAMRQASVLSRAVVRDLVAAGLPTSDIAWMLNVSTARISQLRHETPGARVSPEIRQQLIS